MLAMFYLYRDGHQIFEKYADSLFENTLKVKEVEWMNELCYSEKSSNMNSNVFSFCSAGFSYDRAFLLLRPSFWTCSGAGSTAVISW